MTLAQTALKLAEAKKIIYKSTERPPRFKLNDLVLGRSAFQVFTKIALGNNLSAMKSQLPRGKDRAIQILLMTGIIKEYDIVGNPGYKIARPYWSEAQLADSVVHAKMGEIVVDDSKF